MTRSSREASQAARARAVAGSRREGTRTDETAGHPAGGRQKGIAAAEGASDQTTRGAARPVAHAPLTSVPGPRLPTVQQVSAGGVVYRRATDGQIIEVAIVRVGPKGRWQLPKGIVDQGESPIQTATREVREEAGVDAEIIAPLEEIEYWYVGADAQAQRVRFHKRVHFFLLEYRGGDVADHDDEVDEARWIEVSKAEAMLAFGSERKVMARATQLLISTADSD